MLKDLIKTSIQAKLGDTMRLVKVTANKSSEQISGNYSRIMEEIKKLQLDLKKFQKKTKLLQLIASDSQFLKELEEQYQLLEELEERINLCNDILPNCQLLGKQGDKVRKTLLVTLAEFQKEYDQVYKILHKLAKSKCPSILQSKPSTLMYSIIEYIFNIIKKYNKRHNASVEFLYKEPKYLAEKVSKTGRIRCVRYMLVKNIPTDDGNTKDLYIAVTTLLPKDLESLEDVKMKLSVTVLSDIIRPSLLNVFLVSSTTELQNVLENGFDNFGTSLFEVPIPGKDETRLNKQVGKWNLIDTDGVKVKSSGSIVTITLPKNLYVLTKEGTLERDLEVALFKDVEIFCGFGKNKANGRLQLLTVRPKPDKDGNIVLKYKRKEVLPNTLQKLKEPKIVDDNILENEDNVLKDLDLENLKKQLAKHF